MQEMMDVAVVITSTRKTDANHLRLATVTINGTQTHSFLQAGRHPINSNNKATKAQGNKTETVRS